MSVHYTDPPAVPAPFACPRWCDGDHTGEYADHHRAELGRVAKPGELALIVAIICPTDDSGAPTIELSWEGADEGDTDHYFLEAIDLDVSEIAPFAELLMHARALLTREAGR
jgi:hypothetical protein